VYILATNLLAYYSHHHQCNPLGPKDLQPRLLKISLTSIEDKIAILKNKNKLRLSSNPENVRNLFITSDLTPLEQKKNKVLRQQLAKIK